MRQQAASFLQKNGSGAVLRVPGLLEPPYGSKNDFTICSGKATATSDSERRYNGLLVPLCVRQQMDSL